MTIASGTPLVVCCKLALCETVAAAALGLLETEIERDIASFQLVGTIQTRSCSSQARSARFLVSHSLSLSRERLGSMVT